MSSDHNLDGAARQRKLLAAIQTLVGCDDITLRRLTFLYVMYFIEADWIRPYYPPERMSEDDDDQT